MEFYSQKDPQLSGIPLGPSKLFLGSHGCFLLSMCTLYQKDPKMALPLLMQGGAILKDGNLISSKAAQLFGGKALMATKTPISGWQIAVTEAYAPQFPTHFFCINPDTKEQIDPLDFPAKIEPLSYKIREYRPFTGIALDTKSWKETSKEWAIKNKIISSGWDNPSAPMSQERTAQALLNFEKYITSILPK